MSQVAIKIKKKNTNPPPKKTNKPTWRSLKFHKIYEHNKGEHLILSFPNPPWESSKCSLQGYNFMQEVWKIHFICTYITKSV